ncbi:MAG TPA: glycosyltransferase [Ktedonobacterales bacterium]|jgi:glycosyltransferase involved in cell wall biosynthesis
MRVIVVTEQYLPMLGGVPTVTANLAQDLAAAGHQAWVVAPSQGNYNEESLEGRVRVHRFASFEWPNFNGQRIVFPPVAPLHRLFREVRPDIVHIHSPIVLGTLAQLLAGRMRVPVVGTNHYMPVGMAPTLSSGARIGKGFEAIAYSYLTGFYNRCDMVTAPTATALELLKRHGLRVPSRAISNGIDRQRFNPRPRDEALRRRLGLPSDRPLLLYLGRLSDEKRVHVLLDAMAQLHTPAHLAIGGDGPARDELEAHATALGITRRVTFLGRVSDDDLVPVYRLADVFAMPSVAELQSVATLEALAVGLPVVAANVGALPELVHHGENGLLFAPDDSTDLTACLERLAGDTALRQRMAACALETVIPHDRQRVVVEWERLYTDLAAHQREALARRRRGKAGRAERGLSPRLGRRAPVHAAATQPMVVTRASKGKTAKTRRPPRQPRGVIAPPLPPAPPVTES